MLSLIWTTSRAVVDIVRQSVNRHLRLYEDWCCRDWQLRHWGGYCIHPLEWHVGMRLRTCRLIDSLHPNGVSMPAIHVTSGRCSYCCHRVCIAMSQLACMPL